jgi:two-component system sensor histidine kinase PilS (NtrC family)
VDDDAQNSWLAPTAATAVPDGGEETKEFVRLWQGFMTARMTLGLVMSGLQLFLYFTGTSHSKLLVAISLAYCASTVATRLLGKPRALGVAFNGSWLTLVGVDVVVFSALQFFQGSNINYTPLFALPILLSAVLGPLRLALGTAAAITVLLLGSTLWSYLSAPGDAATYLVQAAFSGVGYFVIALLANQLANRLASEGQRARRNQTVANIQRQVNELVIESLPDGVLIVDENGHVRAANPAARQMLAPRNAVPPPPFDLRSQNGWNPLWTLARMCIGTGQSHEEDVTLRYDGHGPSKVRVRTRLAATQGGGSESLCVLFLQDLRALEARMRTEKLASMGRMSTAVAHEIRNPLAAIAQANALLEEDLPDERLRRLTGMIGQNTKRLGKIVDDILNTAHVTPQQFADPSLQLGLNENIHRMCQEWADQSARNHQLATKLSATDVSVLFEIEHLRRVLVNLLDNAHRYASKKPDAIQVATRVVNSHQAELTVWSDGAPLERTVERHLFEPFFSSESRSSGLGLYICRELCDRHGATLAYQREVREARGEPTEGNEFVITFKRTGRVAASAPDPAPSTPWQTTLY